MRLTSPITVAGPRRIATGFPLPPTLTRPSYRAARNINPVTVNLTRIYTRLGDDGETHLGDMSRVPKTDPRIEAYGTVDELNAQLGLTLTVKELSDEYRAWLQRIQNDLFDVGADIAAPLDTEKERLRVIPEQTTWLEERCDQVNAALPPLKSFVLPGGSVGRRPPSCLPHRVPAGRAAGHRLRRADQPRGDPLPESSLGPSLHSQPRGQPRLRAALGAGPLPLRPRARHRLARGLGTA